MRRLLPLWALVVLATGLSAQEQGASFLHHSISAELLVIDIEPAAQKLIEWAEAGGGYLVYHAGATLALRLPEALRQALRGRLEEIADHLLDYSPAARDLRQGYAAAQAGLNSRREILALNLSYLDDANVEATLAFEQEIVRLMQEIERFRSQLVNLDRDRSYARVDVQLQARGQSLPEKQPSSFGWINTVDLYRFLRESSRDRQGLAAVGPLAGGGRDAGRLRRPAGAAAGRVRRVRGR